MATKGKRPMRALTPGDKIEAIQRVNDGESKASVARDIGVPESTLRGWCKNEDKLRYMTSRLSSPDTDKSNDGEPPDKRARTESPVAPPRSPTAGLDLTTPAPAPLAPPAPLALATPPADAPVELTTKRAEPSPPAHAARERRPDPGASVSMSAISPLSGLAHLPGLAHSHLGLSFNEIATNLTLLAQLNPGLSALSAQPASRALRSVRSPKPAHNGVLNLNEPSKHRSKSHHSDPYARSSSKSSHHHTSSSATSQPVDDTLWYWLKTQQAMLDLTAQTTTAHSLQLGKTDPSIPPKPVAPAAPINSHLDYNRNSWLWQYYKQFGGAMPLPDDKLKSAAQVPKEKAPENILYSHLTKGKPDEERSATSPAQTTPTSQHHEEVHEHREHNAQRVAEPAASPELGTENKEPPVEKSHDSRSHTKARTVLDNLLFNNNNQTASKETTSLEATHGEWEAGSAEALEHGDKFLAWLEASGDPSVTRMHVHQLRALLHNLRARRAPSAALPAAGADLSRRK
ncbi:protein distal antenna-like [Ostrinia nubilalis]|uniref:protein distal antenna-like n=1 Tax=Ostrinia nubilalis TaxID=29057 RepID=UPI0030825AE3